MFKHVLNWAHSFRFLLVGVLAFLLLQGSWANAATNLGTVSSSVHSKVSVQSSTASVGEMVQVQVNLKDSYGQPVPGNKVQLLTSQDVASIYSADFTSDQNGRVNFMVLGENEGITQLIAYDTTSGVMLADKPKLVFIGAGSNAYSPIALASEAGPLDGFRIEGLESGVDLGETLSVTVTAIDELGNTVSDYTGSVRFSSSDSNATLPNDYTYRAEDAGQHVFSLGFRFLESGTQTLTITDIDQFTISSSTSVEVGSSSSSSSSSSSTSSDSDEESFTLISPVSGSTSSNSLTVQGQSTYGYSAIIYLDEEEVARTAVEFDSESFSHTLSNLADGTYDVYVEIAKLGSGEEGEEEILEILEISETETVKIDTTAPEVIQVSTKPEGSTELGNTVTLTLLSESNLEEAYALLNEELYELKSTSSSGKYEVELPSPSTAGDYEIDLILMDSLGNEAEHRNATSISYTEVEESAEEEETEAETTESTEETSAAETEVQTATSLTARSDEGRIALSWEAASMENPIAYYRVYYGPGPDSLFAISDTTDSSTSWTVEDLTGEEIYYFAVAAIDIEGTEGAQSESVLAVPLARTSTSVSENTQTAVIGEDTSLPSETPDSGPANSAIAILSLLGALAYLAQRKVRA